MALRTSREAAPPDGFESIREHAVRQLDWRKREQTNLHLDARVLAPGARILAHRQRIPIERETVMVFADAQPLATWSHPCRYILYDPKSAEPYTEIAARFPPYMVREPRTFRPFHKGIEFRPYLPLPWSLTCRLPRPLRCRSGCRFTRPAGSWSSCRSSAGRPS
ncbi:hypothetical protein J4558_22820 [Leptolyngbya sp. 15MV]|nr:hypothetical protein J4558_22820 [Leptolyngbya sp. 15MV]